MKRAKDGDYENYTDKQWEEEFGHLADAQREELLTESQARIQGLTTPVSLSKEVLEKDGAYEMNGSIWMGDHNLGNVSKAGWIPNPADELAAEEKGISYEEYAGRLIRDHVEQRHKENQELIDHLVDNPKEWEVGRQHFTTDQQFAIDTILAKVHLKRFALGVRWIALGAALILVFLALVALSAH